MPDDDAMSHKPRRDTLGRRRIRSETKMGAQVGIRLEWELYDQLSAMAEALHVDRSWLVRYAILQLLTGSKKNVKSSANLLTRTGPGIRVSKSRKQTPTAVFTSDNICDVGQQGDLAGQKKNRPRC